MKLDVWQKSIELFHLLNHLIRTANNIPYKLRDQILDSAQSISSNISEGYCRRHLNEYIQFLYIALGSAGETLTRLIGLIEGRLIVHEKFESFDTLHYEVENKLLAPIKALETKRDNKEWTDRISEPQMKYLHKPFICN